MSVTLYNTSLIAYSMATKTLQKYAFSFRFIIQFFRTVLSADGPGCGHRSNRASTRRGGFFYFFMNFCVDR